MAVMVDHLYIILVKETKLVDFVEHTANWSNINI